MAGAVLEVMRVMFDGKPWNAIKLAGPEAMVSMPDPTIPWDYEKDPYGPGTLAWQFCDKLRTPKEFAAWVERAKRTWVIFRFSPDGLSVGEALRVEPGGIYEVPAGDATGGSLESNGVVRGSAADAERVLAVLEHTNCPCGGEPPPPPQLPARIPLV